jgi:hypothetical protein
MRVSSSSSYSQSVAVPLPSNGDIRAGIGEDCDATLNVIRVFAGTGEFPPRANRHAAGNLRPFTDVHGWLAEKAWVSANCPFEATDNSKKPGNPPSPKINVCLSTSFSECKDTR